MDIMDSVSNCEKCGEKYANSDWKWCKPCQMDNLKGNFTNWTSGNEKIDNFIQEMQLKNSWNLLEWIPYNQFDDIKEIRQEGFIIIYSGIWKSGPLTYYDKKYTRNSANKKVTLKCLYNSQDLIDEILNEV